MLSSIGGTPAYAFGEIVDLEERIARVWIAEGLAEAAEVETAVQPPVETAVKGRRRKA